MNQKNMLGLPVEPRTLIDNRVWSGQKIALWRSKYAWDIAARQAAEIVTRCRHAPSCPAESAETEPCLADCPDRENRMSALVVLNAARQFAPVHAAKFATQAYTAPGREYFSAIIAELAACQAELEVLRGTVVTVPPPNDSQNQENQT